MTQQHFGRGYGTNAAENYERYFVPAIGRPVADDLINTAALQPGERVLDVGCGTGVVTRLAAERTGGTVAGLDLNPGMLAVARSVMPKELSIEWYESSAEKIPLPDEAFDVVLSQMSLQFFPDKAAALQEMRRVLASGGRLILNVPGKMHRVFEIMEGALEVHIGPEVTGFFRAVFSLHDPDEVRGLVSGAGFEDVEVQTNTVALDVPPADEFLWQYLYATPMAGAMGRMDDERLGALERDVVEKAQDLSEDGVFTVLQDVVVATTKK